MAEPGIRNSPNPSARLEMHGIHKRFGATIALDNVNFSVYPGEVHALVGENGAGKSTLMKILAGVYKPDDGSMTLDSEPYQPRNPMDGRQQGVGMIYQELSLVPHLTVEENIMLGMEPGRFGFIHRTDVRKRTVQAIGHFNNPEIKPEVRVADLPLSAQQLVEIGRSLAIGCRVLVFDEPTSSLSQQDIRQLFDIIRDLKARDLAVVYISHFLEEVQDIADRITVLRDGAVVGTHLISEISVNEIVQLMVGREVNDMYPHTSRKRGEPVLEITDLSGMEKPVSASLTLHRGEVLGIAGLVGAGRTELLRTIFGLDPVRSGKIKIGIYLGAHSPTRRWLQGVGLLSENRKKEGLALNLSIAENITLSKLKNFGPLNLILPRLQNSATQRWIDRLDIRCKNPQQDVHELSGGNQQKVALARLLQHDVDILLLDEPTRGIDVAAKAKIYQVINELAAGVENEKIPLKAILMVSSYIPELLGICDRIAVMSRGKLCVIKDAKEMNEHQIMLIATGQEVDEWK